MGQSKGCDRQANLLYRDTLSYKTSELMPTVAKAILEVYYKTSGDLGISI